MLADRLYDLEPVQLWHVEVKEEEVESEDMEMDFAAARQGRNGKVRCIGP